MLKSFYNWRDLNLAAFMLLLTLILFTSKSLYNYPVGMMALMGLYYVLRNPISIWGNDVSRIFIILFLCLWLPLLASYPDAVNPERSLRTVLPYLRFLFMGIFVIYVINRAETLKILNLFIFYIVIFWCLDALIQYFFGTNLLGYPYSPAHVTGIFYPELTIGHVTAALSPMVFESIRKYGHRNKYFWILLIPVFVVVFLSGRRAAWIMMSVSAIGYTYYYLKLNSFDLKVIKKISAIAILLLISMFLVLASNQALQKRIDVSANLFSGNYELANAAIGKRLYLWETSVNIFRDHWVNGVGPRGYRYIYKDYSSEGDYFHETGQTHPHQLLLEVLVETGLLGFIGLILFVLLFYRFVRKKNLTTVLFPYVLTIIVIIFPINTHMAFYGSYWSSIFWWVMILTFASANIHLSDKTDAKSD
jgi:O-antigen ligase